MFWHVGGLTHLQNNCEKCQNRIQNPLGSLANMGIPAYWGMIVGGSITTMVINQLNVFETTDIVLDSKQYRNISRNDETPPH